MDEGQVETNWTEKTLALRSIARMNDSEAIKNDHGYFTYFKACFNLALAYHQPEERIALAQDYNTLIKYIEAVKGCDKNPETKEWSIQQEKVRFADAHQFFIYDALPAMGIQKPEMDAEIDDKILSLEDSVKIIRTNSGLATSLKGVVVGE